MEALLMGTDWHGLAAQYGAWGLGVAAFLSATLLPLSSEAFLIGGIAAGVPVTTALVASCVGNCLGCTLNYYLGAALRSKVIAKLEASKSGRKAMGWTERWGTMSLWGSWLPFVGDPLTFLAGTARTNFVVFAAIVFGLRIARYVITLLGGSLFVNYS
jgi:membrane protein YqaA with SNARE-associated domain